MMPQFIFLFLVVTKLFLIGYVDALVDDRINNEDIQIIKNINGCQLKSQIKQQQQHSTNITRKISNTNLENCVFDDRDLREAVKKASKDPKKPLTNIALCSKRIYISDIVDINYNVTGIDISNRLINLVCNSKDAPPPCIIDGQYKSRIFFGENTKLNVGPSVGFQNAFTTKSDNLVHGSVFYFWKNSQILVEGYNTKRISNNNASSGGAIYVANSNLTLLGTSNFADRVGALYAYKSNVLIRWGRFISNKALWMSAFRASYSNVTMEYVSFSDNKATISNGALYFEYCDVKLTNVTFNKNIAVSQGGSALQVFRSKVSLANCSFVNNSAAGVIVRRTISFIVLVVFYMASTTTFIKYCWRLQQDFANPTIILKASRRDNASHVIIKVDDYREAYWWLRDNTPEDSRIMAWWDYGYQISAIANRTTLADGITWNHEHIALLGKALTSDLDDGYEIARHLADYVLVWGGGGGDDLAKSPHLARIANSVYRDHCPDDPTCRAFGMVDRQGTPSSMMRNSLLYRLHGFQLKPKIEVPEDKFQVVYRSQYGKVCIYKVIGVSEESKEWVDDIRNKKCDYPGSWFCPGQYPPGLKNILARKTDFRQLEDFNKAGQNDNEYQQQYFRDLQDPEAARRKMLEKEHKERAKEEKHAVTYSKIR